MRGLIREIYNAMQQQATVLAYIDAFLILGTVCLRPAGILLFTKKTKPGRFDGPLDRRPFFAFAGRP